MEQQWLDPAILGVIVGSVLSLVGNLATQWFTLRKEEKQWDKKHAVEKEIREENKISEEIKDKISVFHNTISRLSLIVASDSAEIELQEKEKLSLYQETFDWLSLLSLHLKGDRKEVKEAKQYIELFTDRTHYADSLLNKIREVASTDRTLFPGSQAKTEKIENQNGKKVQIRVAEATRRDAIKECYELRPDFTFECNLNVLTPSQRQKVWDLCRENSTMIPERIVLSTPAYIENTKSIKIKGPGIWETKLNPVTSTPQEIFNEWEKDFDTDFLKAKEDLKSKAP